MKKEHTAERRLITDFLIMNAPRSIDRANTNIDLFVADFQNKSGVSKPFAEEMRLELKKYDPFNIFCDIVRVMLSPPAEATSDDLFALVMVTMEDPDYPAEDARRLAQAVEIIGVTPPGEVATH